MESFLSNIVAERRLRGMDADQDLLDVLLDQLDQQEISQDVVTSTIWITLRNPKPRDSCLNDTLPLQLINHSNQSVYFLQIVKKATKHQTQQSSTKLAVWNPQFQVQNNH